MRILLILLLTGAVPASAQTYAVSTFAGGGFATNVPGPGASLNPPGALALDRAGNVFFTDSLANIVQRLDAKTGLITLVAGNGTAGFSGDNGLAINAQLSGPSGLAIDSAGTLYISDAGNQRIRKVTHGVITTYAGGGTSSAENIPATSALIFEPQGIAVDSSDALYITDGYGAGVRKVVNGVIATAIPNLGMSYAVTVDSAGSIYVIWGLLRYNHTVSKISNGVVQTLATTSPPDQLPNPAAYLLRPQAIAVDSAGTVYVSDSDASRVVTLSGGTFTLVAGTGSPGYTGDGGPARNALLTNPQGIALDPSGNLYIAAGGIRKVTSGTIATVAGGPTSPNGDGGPATRAQIVNPFGVAVDSANNVYLSDANTASIRKVASTSGIITTLATLNDSPHGIATDPAANVYATGYVVQQVYKISPSGAVTPFAGTGRILGDVGDNGPATSAHLYFPNGAATDAGGNVFIADSHNNRIRKVSAGIITTVAGNGTAGFTGDGGPATSAQLNNPNAVATDSAGNLYIADTGNKCIRKITPAGVISSLIPGLNAPMALAADNAANLYFSDSAQIRKFAGGTLTTIAGAGIFANPQGIAVDPSGNLYISDSQAGLGGGLIRLLTPNPAPRIAPGGIVPVYSSVPKIQSGAWISIYGSNLAPATTVWNNDFPTSLGGVTVAIDNKPAYLWFVSPGQINLQVPDDQTTGLVSVVVTTPSGTTTSSVMLQPQAPSLSLLGDNRHVAAQILTSAGYDLAGPANTFSYTTRPVKAGETLVLYGVGFGSTSPAVPAGRVFTGSAQTTSPVTVTIGGLPANVLFAGITQAGLYQINVTVPAAASGDQPIVASGAGVASPSGPIVTIQ